MGDTGAGQPCACSCNRDRRFGISSLGDDLSKLVHIIGCICFGGLPVIAGGVFQIWGDRKRSKGHDSKIIDPLNARIVVPALYFETSSATVTLAVTSKSPASTGVGTAAFAITAISCIGRIGAEKSTVSASATPTTCTPRAAAIASALARAFRVACPI